MSKIKIFLLSFLLNFLVFSSFSFSEIIKKIEITGNNRISDETILMFSKVDIGQSVKNDKINQILKDLYNSNFFNNVSVKIEKNTLFIKIDEAPLIKDIKITGVKAEKFKKAIRDSLILKPRRSFNNFLLTKEKTIIQSKLKSAGYYFVNIDPIIELLDDNMVSINYKIDLGEKSKIRKISFIGDKIYKDSKLKSIIISEEYKFWKFISGKKFLREETIEIDKRLLKNFYLNKGFYNVEINTSFAKLINENEFELIFNINPNQKIFFGDMNFILPNDFDEKNYKDLNKLLVDLKGEPYSIYSVDKILNEIDLITINDEYKSANAYVKQNIVSDRLNIDFVVEEGEAFFIERINILGNNVTRENVIRNQLEIDEGDPYNEILANKSLNNLKSLNFFKSVKTDVITGKNLNSKIINYNFEEKPTGEIVAGAGVGTDGGSIFFGVKENNYLGKGLSVNTNATISTESLKGNFSITNPNFNNSDKSFFINIKAEETDKLKDFGYKTNKTGFSLGTNFEYLKDFNLGLSTSSFVEKMETDSTASASQQKQAGNYWDTFLKFNFDYDKRNQKFKTTDGFRSYYSIDVPLISDTNTLTNSYDYKVFNEFYENNITTFSISLSSANSISDEDVKLSERLFIPSRKLRGFESGKVGPKDGADFIGGNYLTTFNVQTNVPTIFENAQNLDAVIFFDVASLWGVDYNSSLDDGGKLRSSLGIGIDWFTVVGPLSFSLTEVITKEDTDKTEKFRFNLGTTF
ncbi:outer membrane protein assembly factor BamA [Pelagibacterales bacterium SAG-MED49]|nr:outer membrane protein assembly factor BamA [Pelagibacterales bacterium SAG-MED49]